MRMEANKGNQGEGSMHFGHPPIWKVEKVHQPLWDNIASRQDCGTSGVRSEMSRLQGMQIVGVLFWFETGG